MPNLIAILRPLRPRSCSRYLWVAFLLLLMWPPVALSGPLPIRIAITPCTDIVKSFALYQPLAAYLEQQTGRRVTLVIPKNFNEFERLVQSGETEFAFQAPHTYVRLASFYNKQHLLKALTPEGKTSHRGVIIVRKDSPLKRVEDLRGKQFLFGAENDLAKSLAAWRLLEKHGIQPTTDLANFKHDGSCESIALNVFLKSVDAGMVCDYSFEEINEAREHGEGEIPPHQLRVLARTEEVPTWVFAALKGADQNLVRQVTKALTALNRTRKEHRNVLEEAEAGGFVPARDSDFDGVRKMLPSTRRTP